MEYTINRSIKKPGLIDGARTFFLQYNNVGLYLICLGRATQTPKQTNDFLVNAMADKAVDFFQNKYEKKIRETEVRLRNEKLDDLVKEKHCYFLKPEEIQQFKLTTESDTTIKIHIKGGKLNIKLYTHPHYKNLAETIESLLNKK